MDTCVLRSHALAFLLHMIQLLMIYLNHAIIQLDIKLFRSNQKLKMTKQTENKPLSFDENKTNDHAWGCKHCQCYNKS